LKAAIAAWYNTAAVSMSNKTIVTPTITNPTVTAVTPGPAALVATLGTLQVRADAGNVALGSGHSHVTTGDQNTAVGRNAQGALTTGRSNMALGVNAQLALTTGGDNVAIGVGAQQQLKTANMNTAIGKSTQSVLTTGTNNTAIGNTAQAGMTTGTFNTAVGDGAQMYPRADPKVQSTTASYQTSVGAQTGQATTTPVDGITTIGYRATAGAVNATSLGTMSSAVHADSVALGSNTLTTAAAQVMVGARDVEITDATKGVVLHSPDGKRWRITVSNAGAVTAAAV
jgi:hypothetical protein